MICPECGKEADDVDLIPGEKVYYHGMYTKGGTIDATEKCYVER